MITTVTEAFAAGFAITLDSVLKRMEVDGIRDFHPRFIWEAETSKHQLGNTNWEGFATPEECVTDMLIEINKVLA
jgi:hypothetical protein